MAFMHFNIKGYMGCLAIRIKSIDISIHVRNYCLMQKDLVIA